MKTSFKGERRNDFPLRSEVRLSALTPIQHHTGARIQEKEIKGIQIGKDIFVFRYHNGQCRSSNEIYQNKRKATSIKMLWNTMCYRLNVCAL